MGANQSVNDDSDSGSDEEEEERQRGEDEGEEDDEEEDGEEEQRGVANRGQAGNGVDEDRMEEGDEQGEGLPEGGEQRSLVGRDCRPARVPVAASSAPGSRHPAQPNHHNPDSVRGNDLAAEEEWPLTSKGNSKGNSKGTSKQREAKREPSSEEGGSYRREVVGGPPRSGLRSYSRADGPTGAGGRLGDAGRANGLNGTRVREKTSIRSSGDSSGTSPSGAAAGAGAGAGAGDGTAGTGAGGVLLLEQEPEVSPFRQSQLPVEPQHNSPQSSLPAPTPHDMLPAVRLLPPTAAAAPAAASGNSSSGAGAPAPASPAAPAAAAAAAVAAAMVALEGVGQGLVNADVVAPSGAGSGSRSRSSSGGSTSSAGSSSSGGSADGFAGKLAGESSDGTESYSSVSSSRSGGYGASFAAAAAGEGGGESKESATSRSIASSVGDSGELSLSHMLAPSPAVADALAAAAEAHGEGKPGRRGGKEQSWVSGEKLVTVRPGSNGVIVAAVGTVAGPEMTSGGDDPPAPYDPAAAAAAVAAGGAAAGITAGAGGGGVVSDGEKVEAGKGNGEEAAGSEAWQGLLDAQLDVMSVSRPLSSHPFLHSSFTPSDFSTEFYIIRHGEASHNVSTLIGGRSHDAPLTALGQRQAHLLGAFLRDYAALRFDAIFSSPIERSKQTAVIVCQEIGESESRIQYSDELQELSQGSWERQPRQSIYHHGVLEQMTAAQPDFRAPGGESQRQVEFRMVEFINSVLFARQHLISPGPSALAAAHCLGLHTSHSAPSLHHLSASPSPSSSSSTSSSAAAFSSTSFSSSFSSSAATATKERRPRPPFFSPGAQATGGDAAAAAATSGDSQSSGTNGNAGNAHASHASSSSGSHHSKDGVFRVAVFSHGTAIRCLLRGLLGSNPHLTQNIGIDNTSITVLKHTSKKGWHLVKTNDTAHLIIAKGPLSSQQACC